MKIFVRIGSQNSLRYCIIELAQSTSANAKQIDMEMSWADGQYVMQTVEELVKGIHGQIESEQPGVVNNIELLKTGFPRVTYEEAMSKHGSDKPDLRILDLVNKLSPFLEQS